jgi:hypothetical protein
MQLSSGDGRRFPASVKRDCTRLIDEWDLWSFGQSGVEIRDAGGHPRPDERDAVGGSPMRLLIAIQMHLT